MCQIKNVPLMLKFLCTILRRKFTETVLELGFPVGGDVHHGKAYLLPKLSEVCMKLKKLGSLEEHAPGAIPSIFDSVCCVLVLKFLTCTTMTFR